MRSPGAGPQASPGPPGVPLPVSAASRVRVKVAVDAGRLRSPAGPCWLPGSGGPDTRLPAGSSARTAAGGPMACKRTGPPQSACSIPDAPWCRWCWPASSGVREVLLVGSGSRGLATARWPASAAGCGVNERRSAMVQLQVACLVGRRACVPGEMAQAAAAWSPDHGPYCRRSDSVQMPCVWRHPQAAQIPGGRVSFGAGRISRLPPELATGTRRPYGGLHRRAGMTCRARMPRARRPWNVPG